MKLIIFDLDQTLVDFLPLHNETVSRLFRIFFKVGAKLTEVDFAGRSLQENLADLARLKNVSKPDFERCLQAMLKSYDEILLALIPDNASEYILPGVKELLNTLSKKNNLLMLYTGDSPAIVTKMLKTTELGQYFKDCFYGTPAKTRTEMVTKAIKKAEQLAGQKIAGNDVVVIGDSIRDIDAGKEAKALTIAVETGLHDEKTLRSHQPDFVFKNLTDTRSILQAIG